MALSKRELDSLEKDYLYVLAHSQRQRKKKKQPSVAYVGEKNPKLALELAVLVLEIIQDARVLIQNESIIDAFEIAWLIKNLPELAVFDVTRELTLTCQNTEDFSFINFVRLRDLFDTYLDWTGKGPMSEADMCEGIRGDVFLHIDYCGELCPEPERDYITGLNSGAEIEEYLDSIIFDKKKFEAAIDFFAKKTIKRMKLRLRRYFMKASKEVQALMTVALSKIYNADIYVPSVKESAYYIETGRQMVQDV